MIPDSQQKFYFIFYLLVVLLDVFVIWLFEQFLSIYLFDDAVNIHSYTLDNSVIHITEISTVQVLETMCEFILQKHTFDPTLFFLLRSNINLIRFFIIWLLFPHFQIF